MIKGRADVQTPTFHPEVRMAEMVSMGVGNKAFRDIAPSEEAINDRTVNYILKCQGSRQAAGVGWGELLRERCGPLAALACTPLRTSAQLGSGLTQTDSLMQQFALGPPLLWLLLTLTAPTWGPQAPFLEILPLALYWGPSTCICTETQLFWGSAGPCIPPVSQRKQHWRLMPNWAASHL